MKLVSTCFILSLSIINVNALFGYDWVPTWDTLRVTFKLNLFSKWAFAKMPLTRNDAEKAGFRLIGEDKCSDTFLGFRYIKDDDPAVILLYDVKGYIAGIQSSFAENEMSTEAKATFKNHPMFTVEHLSLNVSDNFYTLTAYLVDPSIICTTGRSEKEFDDHEGGTNLYLKNGTETILVPKKQENLTETNWTLGRCFPGMGVHYWYQTSLDMNCDHFQPVFLMYNHGDLTGFGFAVNGMFNSQRYEHPTKDVLGKFFKVVPQCLIEAVDKIGALSTLHVYMNGKPWNMVC